MFRTVSPSIIRSRKLYIQHHTIQVLSLLVNKQPQNCVPTAPQQRKVTETVLPVPDAVITVICAPDDGWSYHPKHIEQFTEL
jgi:hypothetical protein